MAYLPAAGESQQQIPLEQAKVYVRLRPLNVGVIEKLAHPAYSVAADGQLLLSMPEQKTSYSFYVNGK